MNNLSYRHLKAFLEVARHGSFTQAAEYLHLTQSTLTATIKQLEAHTELQLLDRTTRRVNLTRAGERFFPIAERLVSDFDTAIDDLKASAHQKQGHISISASPSVLSTLLPALIENYRRDYPKVSIQLNEEGASTIEESVLNNVADFGIGGNHSSNPELHYEPLLQDRYGVVMRPDHPLSCSTDELIWQAISAENFLSLSKDNGIRLEIDRLIKQGEISIQNHEGQIEASKPATLAPLIHQKLGIAILPALAVSTLPFHGLIFKPLSEPDMYRELCIVSKRGRSLSPASKELLSRARPFFEHINLPTYVSTLKK